MPDFASPAALAVGLAATGYLADEGLAMAGFLALRLHRPIFLEGDAGVGKTAFAAALAETAGVELIRLQCYEGLDASHALYDWDFARQILHLRAVETAAHGTLSAAALEADLYDRRFLLARPLLQAVERAPCVLLVDEVDRADDEFEAYLLEVLADAAVTVPELGRITATVPPIVVVTSNRTREVHDALKRRCLYHWVGHPTPEREAAILRRRLPQRGQHGPRQQEALVVEALLGLVGVDLTGRLEGAEVQDLAREVPVVESLAGVDALVALQAHEREVEALGEGLGEGGLAGAGLALEQQRTLHARGQEHDRRELVVGEVSGRAQPGGHVSGGVHG